jgi:hypothetical protein
MFAKHKREKFCNILGKYWSRFASNWDVLLHGSPAVDIYGGMKLAAGGELGMGVGEEEWGSSERDVLEDFARRTDGLVDLVVSRFGETSALQQPKTSTDPKTLDLVDMEAWIGSGGHVNAADGVVFSGLGSVSRRSLRDLSHWIENIYSYGDQAYGVRDNPTSDRRKRKRRIVKPSSSPAPGDCKTSNDDKQLPAASSLDPDLPLGIPRPIVKAAESSLDKASAAVDNANANGSEPPNHESGRMLASLGDTETWMKVMTLGYGTAWGGKKLPEEVKLSAKEPLPRTPSPEAMRYIEPEPDIDFAEERLKTLVKQENDGYFVVGLKGDMRDVDEDDDNDEGNWNNRIPLRTVHVEVIRRENSLPVPSVDSDETPTYERDSSFASRVSNRLTRLRPVVYVVSLPLHDALRN